MFRNKGLILTALLLAMVASPAANAAKLKLDSFSDQSPATIDLPATKLLMATVATTAQGGGGAADALTTTVTIGGSVVAADIAAVCVDYNAGEVACVANPNPLTNIVVTLTGTQPGGAPFDYRVTLNPSAAGKTIFLSVDGFTATDLNDTIPLPQSTTTRDITGSAAAPIVVALPATGHLSDRATLWGQVTDTGGPAITTPLGIIWDTDSDPQTGGTDVAIAVPSTETDPFSTEVTGLTQDTPYWFVAYATNTEGTSYSSPQAFSLEKPTLVATPTIADQTANSATFGGEVTAIGSNSPSDCGVEWSTTSGPGPYGAFSASAGACSVGTFTVGTGATLTLGTTYYYRSYATNTVDTAYSANEGSYKPLNKPTVTTGGATPAQTQATLAGTVTNDGGEIPSDCSIKWSITSDIVAPYTYDDSASAGACTENNEFTVTALLLSPGTTYYYRAFATNGAGEEPASNELSFQTDAGAPTMVATPTVDAVGDASATLRGELSSTGGGTISDCGIDWRTDIGSYGGAGSGSAALGAGCSVGVSFTRPATSLTNGTTYYFRSWAINESGTSYSTNEGSFVPYTAPSVTTGGYTPPTQTETTLAGTVTDNGGSAITDCGVEWRIDTGAYGDGDSGRASYGVCSVGVEYTVNATSLSPGVTYFYRAFADTALSVETPAGAEDSFTTDIGLPTVGTRLAESLAATTAVLGGDVTATGGATVTDRGVIWNTSGALDTGTPVPMGSGPGPFSGLVTYSPDSALVYFQAYATNSVGTAYSDQQFFQYVSGQPKDIVVERVTGQAIKFYWTPGVGDGTLVVIRATGSTSEVVPGDGYDYLDLPPYPNADYSLPPPELNDGTGSGNFVVYQGSGDSIWIYGLTLETNYTIKLYDYTGTVFNTDGPAVLVQSTTDERVHNYDNRVSCGLNCHDAHGGFHPRGQELNDVCTACHTSGGLAENKVGFSATGDGHPTPGSNPNIDTVDCGRCHELHNPSVINTTVSTHPITPTVDYNKAFLRAGVDKYVPNAATPASLHGGDTATENTDIPQIGEANPDGTVVSDTPNRAIEGGGAATARGYCQVCHTYTKYHRSTGMTTGQTLPDGSVSAVHDGWAQIQTDGGDPRCHDGLDNDSCGAGTVGNPDTNPTLATPQTNCGNCHRHSNNFQGSGGSTSCIDCHAVGGAGVGGTNNRPAIVEKFALTRSHIPGGGVTEPDCLVCHDQTGHSQDAIVGLKDLDTGAIYNQPNATASTLAPAEAEKFAPNCMSCHDDASADQLGTSGDQTDTSPFTGTVVATFADRIIDETAWGSASHNRPASGSPTSPTFGANPVTCLGDGNTGCHASGHGTDSPSLLADVTFPTPDYTAFCINCHNGDGPSDIDIFGLLDPVANGDARVRSASPSGFQAVANQRHDLLAADQTYSGAVLTCKDCHTPHVDNNDNPVTNPDDRSAIGNYSPAIYSDGVTFRDPVNPAGIAGGRTEPDYVEFCLVCHDGSPPPGVTMTTDGTLVNIASFYLTEGGGDQHGMGYGSTGSSTSKGGLKAPWVNATEDAADDDPAENYAALNCTMCHGAHGSKNIYNLRTEITVGGVPMTVGGTAPRGGVLDEPHYNGSAYYELPDPSGLGQEDHFWGAWCTFCHKMDGHPTKDENEVCNGPHMHGGNGF